MEFSLFLTNFRYNSCWGIWLHQELCWLTIHNINDLPTYSFKWFGWGSFNFSSLVKIWKMRKLIWAAENELGWGLKVSQVFHTVLVKFRVFTFPIYKQIMMIFRNDGARQKQFCRSFIIYQLGVLLHDSIKWL